jgi:thymidine kinase
MAKLYFRYGAMNSGKTTALLQVAHNYKERDMNTIIIKPAIDTKGNNKIVSRLGVEKEVDVLVFRDDDLSKKLEPYLDKINCISS